MTEWSGAAANVQAVKRSQSDGAQPKTKKPKLGGKGAKQGGEDAKQGERIVIDDEEHDVVEVESSAAGGEDEFGDDDELMELVDRTSSSQAGQAGQAGPQKAQAGPPAKPAKPAEAAKPAKPAKPAKTQAAQATAADVLNTIPDAELPEAVATGEGFNYQAFKAHQATLPVQEGTVELPQGAPNCLLGLTMVFTGVLPNISRDESENLAKKYGAKVTKSISSKTSVVVLGEEAGPSKVAKIKKLKIKAINQDGFFQLIRGMPEAGGSGEAAEKARLKKQQEEEHELQESAKLAAQQEQQARELARKIKAARDSGNVASLGKLKTDDEKLWTVKYAPTELAQICGNKSSVQRMYTWLEQWHATFGSGKPAKGETEMRAILVHGPPGIGKTTAAHLVAKKLGYDVLEQNASDVRSKNLLNSRVGNALGNSSVVGYFSKDTKQNKFVIIMDEVDGMSGGDRGGVGQLASYCRKTQVPLILICNDKSLPKMRPFDRVTLDIPFRRPSAKEMKSRLMTIALREHIKLDPNVVDNLVATTSNDIRQIINLLSTVSRTQKAITCANSDDITKSWQKNVALKPFDIIPRLLNGQIYLPNSAVPLYKKMEYYFDDHAFVPLMLQENYLSTRPARGGSKLQHLELVAQAADAISFGDIVDRKIHSSEQQWSLMPFHAVMSTVLPASYVAGTITSRINFTGWLGQNSKTGKFYRLLTEINYRARLRTGASQTELRLEYVPLLVRKLLDPLTASEPDIDAIIETLDYYYLSKADWDALMDLAIGPCATAALIKKVPAKVKSKFTRAYNSRAHPVSVYRPGLSTGVGTPAKSAAADNNDEVVDDEDEEADIFE